MRGRHLISTALAVLVATAAAAQPAASAPAPAAQPTDPLLLPGDGAPPPLSNMLRFPSGRPLPPPDTTPGPPTALALKGVQAAVAACAAQGLRVGAVVVDSEGHLKAGLMSDGAPPGALFTAARKGQAVLAFGTPTSEVQALLRRDAAAAARLQPTMAVYPGGVPLRQGGRIVGALAASGATGEQDEVCAAAGAASIKDELK